MLAIMSWSFSQVSGFCSLWVWMTPWQSFAVKMQNSDETRVGLKQNWSCTVNDSVRHSVVIWFDEYLFQPDTSLMSFVVYWAVHIKYLCVPSSLSRKTAAWRMFLLIILMVFLYSIVLSSWADSLHFCHLWLWMSDCSLSLCISEVMYFSFSTIWLLHGWCHMKLLPS